MVSEFCVFKVNKGLSKFSLKYFTFFAFTLLFLATHEDTFGQGGTRVIQFSGVILGEDSVSGVPGVHIYVPKAGRGTTSNVYGYFSMPALVGDSVVVSAVGYEKQSFIVPGDKGDNFTVVIELVTDTTYLPPVEILPYPTEELFKQAVLALKLPDERDYRNMEESLRGDLLLQMMQGTSMDASENYRYYTNQQFLSMTDRFQPRSNPLLNPFAWAQFIKSLKKNKK